MIIQGDDVYVWPYNRGDKRGMEVAPLYKTVPEVSVNNQEFYELLTLVDAIRIGRTREVNLATEELKKRLKYV